MSGEFGGLASEGKLKQSTAKSSIADSTLEGFHSKAAVKPASISDSFLRQVLIGASKEVQSVLDSMMTKYYPTGLHKKTQGLKVAILKGGSINQRPAADTSPKQEEKTEQLFRRVSKIGSRVDDFQDPINVYSDNYARNSRTNVGSKRVSAV